MTRSSPRCLRCRDTGSDPEYNTSGSINSGVPEPPALEPCVGCQYPESPNHRPADTCGESIAFRIRAELVCCDIYERVNDAEKMTFREAMDGRDWHDLCYWGEASARIAEGRCPGYETIPNICRCACEGCQHNCGAHRDEAIPGRRRKLTPRQAEFLQMAADGLTNQQIAAAAFVTVDTVKTILRITFQKLGVESRGHAVGVAIKLGEIDYRTITIPQPRRSVSTHHSEQKDSEDAQTPIDKATG